MSLSPNTALAHYTIISKIGAGGRKQLSLDPTFPTTYLSLTSLYQLTGKYAESVESYARYQELSDRRQTAKLIRESFASGGWQAYLREMTSKQQPGVTPYIAATLFVQLGETDKAFEALSRSLENREWQLLYVKIDPRIDPLRNDPRLKELFKRLRFPE